MFSLISRFIIIILEEGGYRQWHFNTEDRATATECDHSDRRLLQGSSRHRKPQSLTTGSLPQAIIRIFFVLRFSINIMVKFYSYLDVMYIDVKTPLDTSLEMSHIGSIILVPLYFGFRTILHSLPFFKGFLRGFHCIRIISSWISLRLKRFPLLQHVGSFTFLLYSRFSLIRTRWDHKN